jgi:uncharacterized ferritin-like protein (DUF455 family)
MDCTQQESLLTVAGVWEKLERVPRDLAEALEGRLRIVPEAPGRDLEVRPPEGLPKKRGLASREGQARMLHDLASIELQALELGLRTLIEYPEAPAGFREELAAVTASEATHLRLCLEALEHLGHPWGSWPAHISLWQAVGSGEPLLDRILIVHRYLEGSGLDAGETLLRRLLGVAQGPAHAVVGQIVREEVGHVEFGSRWYRKICELEKLDPSDDFSKRFLSLVERIPKRIEPVSRELRRKAGFTDAEISFLEEYRASIQKFPGLREKDERPSVLALLSE